ncbi:CcoQ/FixQ family Cbb3-type cytochrome c oxidase assembly chaperone [Achromobacter ruhlandii]|uniref:CcoQ/FixQ family Cbb3-type cytochrome c oxidase assembly chaperone n=1 Tax=Achromobacter ruhlandii TaxID=72557 RepID=UPI001EED0480
MMALLSAIVTAISMATFFGIVWWACSRGRQHANSESAMLPFALPDEFGPAQQDGADQS